MFPFGVGHGPLTSGRTGAVVIVSQTLPSGSGRRPLAAVGMELDLRSRGLGVRSDRYSMIVEDGVVKAFNREKPGQFEVSSAEAMLKAL